MRLDQQFPAASRPARLVVVAAFLFASGLPLSAFGQPPAQQPPQPPATQQMPQIQTGTLPTSNAGQAAVANGMPLSIDDAVRMALENNLGIQGERLTPQIQSMGTARARAAFAPALFTNFSKNSNTQPPQDFLSSGVAVTTRAGIQTQAGVQQQLPWGGGAYTVSWDAARATNDAPRTVYSPSLDSQLNLQYTQPLLRNFTIDNFRQQVRQSLNQQQQADLQLQDRITRTSRNVRIAYYNLVGAVAGLDVAQQSLDLARESLKNNQTRVEVGTMAPIDIVAAEAEVASNEEAVIIAEAQIRSAEDQLRALIMNPKQPDFWTTEFRPTEQPVLAAQTIDVDAAIGNALQNRTDVLQLKKQIESTDIDLRFASNQRLPSVDLQVDYGVTGVGGTQLEWGGGVDGTPVVIGRSVRSFGDVLRDVFGNDFRTWRVGLNVSYPIGRSQAEAALAQGRLQKQQQQTTLTDLEMQVATQVREAARSVNTNLKRVEATRKARELAEQRLQAEQKRFTVGLSTTFELFQAQRDLARARQSELNATIDYNRSLVDFEAVQITPIR